MQIGSKDGTFNSIRRQAIRQGLSNVLGASGATATIINFGLDAYEDNPAAFHNSLHSLFKVPGTEILEKSIVKEIYAQMGERFNSSESFDYVTQMNFAKKLYGARLGR